MSTPKRKSLTVVLAAVVVVSVILSVFALLYISLTGAGGPGYAVEAQRARDTNDPAAERAALEALAEADPQHVESLERLARIAREEGQFLDAARQWGEVASLDPMHAGARFEQARNIYAAGNHGRAIELLEALADGNNPDVGVLHAMALFGTDRPDEAGVILDKVLSSHPEHGAARLLAADRLFIDGRLKEAEAAYRVLYSTEESAPAAHLGLVQTLLRQGQDDKAQVLMRERPAGPEASFQLLSAHANFWRQVGDLDAAIEVYQHLLERYGPLPDILVPMGELSASAGDPATVHSLREKLVGTTAAVLAARHYLDAIAAYLGESPGVALQRLAWSERYYGNRDLFRWIELDAATREGLVDRSAAAVRTLLSLKVVPLRLEHAADLVAARAARWVDGGERHKAETLGRQALELQPDHPAARLVLARVALIDGRADAAAVWARGLLDADQMRTGALEVLGRASMATGDMAAAEARFRELAQALPASSIGPYWLGVNLFRQGLYEQAATELRLAYQRNSEPRVSASLLDTLIRLQDWDAAMALADEQLAGSDAAGRAIGWAYKAGVHRARGDLRAAADAYQKAMAEDGQRLAYALATADLLADLGERQRARQILDEAARKGPQTRVLRFKRAYLAQLDGEAQAATELYRGLLGDYPEWALVMVNLSELLGAAQDTRAEALVMASRAAELIPGWEVAHWNLAQRAIESDEVALARQSVERVLDISPSNAEARALLAEIEQRAQ